MNCLHFLQTKLQASKDGPSKEQKILTKIKSKSPWSNNFVIRDMVRACFSGFLWYFSIKDFLCCIHTVVTCSRTAEKY